MDSAQARKMGIAPKRITTDGSLTLMPAFANTGRVGRPPDHTSPFDISVKCSIVTLFLESILNVRPAYA